MRRCLRRLVTDWKACSDAELAEAVRASKLSFYGLEEVLKPDYERAIRVRRSIVAEHHAVGPQDRVAAISGVPYESYDWSQVVKRNCENVIGYVPIPVGLAGPILIDGIEYPIPMATTEGALVASTHRGARAINKCGGCTSIVINEGMTRAPVIELPSLEEAAKLKKFVAHHFADIKAAFDSTTRFGKLLDLKVAIAGRKVYLRFRASTGDAMGMNMVTKGVDKSLQLIMEKFPGVRILALSGNYCTDKKPSAINWVEGRGKSVVAEATVSSKVVEEVLKTSVKDLVRLNIDKNFVGSAMAGSLGGFNAQAANVVAAVFLATGQDPAQVVESSTCLTQMSEDDDGALRISVTMPSIEVGTIGGGTALTVQKSLLQLVGCAGASDTHPGDHAKMLARVVAAGVLSAELSLMSGLAANHLLSAHMTLNR